MTKEAQALLDAARALSPEERVEVADGLLRDIGPPSHVARDEAYWRDELPRRARAIDRGAPTHDAEAVLDQLDAALDRE